MPGTLPELAGKTNRSWFTTFDPFEVNMSLHLGQTYCIEINKEIINKHRQWFSMFLFFLFVDPIFTQTSLDQWL